MDTPGQVTVPARPSGCLPALVTEVVRLAARRLPRGEAGTWAVGAASTSSSRRLWPRWPAASATGRGLALRGAVWTGHGDEAFDGVVIVGADGAVAAVGPAGAFALPEALPVVDCAWVGPGVTDAHVQLGEAAPAGPEGLAGALVAVRDLGSPPHRLAPWRSSAPIVIVSSGLPLVGVSGHSGNGAATVVDGPAAARRVVARLVSEDVDLLEVRVADGGSAATRAGGPRGASGNGTAWARCAAGAAGQPGVEADGLAAVVDAAHAAGVPVVAYALSEAAVRTAVRARVDELAGVPVEQLPPATVELLADAGIPVVSALQRHAAAGPGAARNAAELHRAGVRLVYGTAAPPTAAEGAHTGSVGVDPRELDRLAFAGLGRLGALRAATAGAAKAAGLAGRAPSGHIDVGRRAALVGLYADPLVEPTAWRCPAVVVRGPAVLSRDGAEAR